MRCSSHIKKYALWICAAVSLACSPLSPAHAASPLQAAMRILHIEDGAEVVPPPASVELAFSPNGGAENLVIKAIGSAKRSIDVAAYAFTSHPIAEALIAAHGKGVNVRVVIDHEQVEKYYHSIAPYLIAHGVKLRVDIVHSLMHDKYLVIDGKTVETGSFNYTVSAQRYNAENV
ncbi:MAG: phospholipase D family protein, partial [Alphaproteobacteria bacterium]|nr:phospholipase D family protein [Alphaproteobacteria bacterium]